uniref:ME53 n=1 Tax=Spilarctia obliqua nucleopolyhedrovirus TaxID=1638618 RepID=A0A7G9U8K1_9ABAC|nr:ME53 [Spilarctia obliqua nucleopolyhedrovirus]
MKSLLRFATNYVLGYINSKDILTFGQAARLQVKTGWNTCRNLNVPCADTNSKTTLGFGCCMLLCANRRAKTPVRDVTNLVALSLLAATAATITTTN